MTSFHPLARLVIFLGLSLAAQTAWAQPAREPVQPVRHSSATGPLRIAIAGLVHGHVEGLLWAARDRDDIEVVGIHETDAALFDRLAARYSLAPSLRFDDLGAMLDATKPEAISVMTSIADHLAVVEACAPRGIHLLLEKPLAFTATDAHRMRDLANTHGVLVLTNFETSWYSSIREAGYLADAGELGAIRRMIFRHGHRGPIEIGVYDEFSSWLTDPAANGGGAIVDFGCYGAALATWLMDGKRPTHVRAIVNQIKPGLYHRVDDDATIVLTYPTSTAVIQASWAWTHDNKEMDIHGELGSAHARKWNDLHVRRPDSAPLRVSPSAQATAMDNEWTYLRHVVRGNYPVDPLSSLSLNVIVAEILDTARRDAGLQVDR